MAHKQVTYSFVIPVYNEEAVLFHMFERMTSLINKLDAPAEIILIDDGSDDKSYELMKDQHEKDPHYKIIKFSRNFGHQNAVTAGINASAGKAVIIIDADLQDPPEVALELIKQWKIGFDVVHAIRQSREGETIFKLFTADLFYRFLNYITDTKIIKNAGDFRLLDQKVVKEFRKLGEQHRYIRGLSCWLGFKQSCIFYERKARYAGVTKYPLKKMIKFAANAVTSFSAWPLHISFKCGMIISSCAFLMGLAFIFMKIMGTAAFVSGWTSLIVVIAFFNGLLMIMIGLLGIYVGRIFQEAKGRPLYITEQLHGIEKS